MNMRIGIVGCAGTGKTTLAEALAVELGVPCLRAKEVTTAILDRDGYDFSSGIQVERFLAGMGRQNEILRCTLEQQECENAFVTDRTVVDLAAYVVVEMHDSDGARLKTIYDTCRERVDMYTHLVVCPWAEGPVSANNRRTLNPWYQAMIHFVDLGLLAEWGCRFHVMKAKGVEARVAEAQRVLESWDNHEA